MKLTQVLYRQHIGRMFKKHWIVQGQRVPEQTNADKVLLSKSIEIIDPKELFKEPKKVYNLNIIGVAPKPISLDENHPNYKSKVCHIYGDKDVLLEGIEQAKVITKTVEISDNLPDILTPQRVSKITEKLATMAILESHVFDAEQEKLPKVKDPARPAWNFPRTYGITSSKKIRSLTSKLLHLCETNNPDLALQRNIIPDAIVLFPFQKDGDLFQLELRQDLLLTAKEGLSPVTDETTDSVSLPDLFPIKYTITLPKQHFYAIENSYPVNKITTHNSYSPHTVFVHHDPTEVSNLFETEVTEKQILGRSVMKTFAAAASYARLRYGNDVGDLPRPVTVQCVNTDGNNFYFGVLQLNTLNLDGVEGNKNVWFMKPRMVLYDYCGYKDGRPILEKYNPEVFKQLVAFYNNK